MRGSSLFWSQILASVTKGCSEMIIKPSSRRGNIIAQDSGASPTHANDKLIIEACTAVPESELDMFSVTRQAYWLG
jgi:hypothetical protein